MGLNHLSNGILWVQKRLDTRSVKGVVALYWKGPSHRWKGVTFLVVKTSGRLSNLDVSKERFPHIRP